MTQDNLDQKYLEITSKNFLEELIASYKGHKTSLPFIAHKLSPASLIKNNDNFQALVIGGSLMKKALLKKIKKEIEVVKIEKEKNIYFENGNSFLEFVFQELYPGIKTLGLNFAYPLEPVFENGKMDGVFCATTKGARLHHLIGKKIGKEIETYVFVKSKRKIKVAVANDTVCLMLSGLTKFKRDELAAGVVGTGINFSLFKSKNTLVNLQSAGFNKFTQTPEGKIIDRESDKQGNALFEKETAGAYLYKHFNLLLKKYAVNYPDISSTEELDQISRSNIPRVSDIAQSLLERSAQLTACQIAGIASLKQSDMVFVMEGSLFWKGNNFKEIVAKTVKRLVPKYKVNFVKIKNSAILGAAKLIC